MAVPGINPCGRKIPQDRGLSAVKTGRKITTYTVKTRHELKAVLPKCETPYQAKTTLDSGDDEDVLCCVSSKYIAATQYGKILKVSDVFLTVNLSRSLPPKLYFTLFCFVVLMDSKTTTTTTTFSALRYSWSHGHQRRYNRRSLLTRPSSNVVLSSSLLLSSASSVPLPTLGPCQG